MPFDAMVAIRRQAISEALERNGLSAVSWEVLAAHKQAQLQRFGPSFWYRHRAAVALALVFGSPIVGLLVGAANAFRGHATLLAIGSSFAWLCLVAVITGTSVVRLRAGSHWRERWIPAAWLDDLGVPEPIAAVARRLQRDMPDATLIVGELLRDEVVLDPYLLIECGDERVCLGVWEGERVIACAGDLAASGSEGVA